MRQICAERYVWAGVPFGCEQCGGAIFQRAQSDRAPEEFWEDDPVNERIYSIPEVRAAFTRKYERYLACLSNGASGKKALLEIGCGSGIFLEAALRHGWSVYGLDISQQAVELTRRFCPAATVRCSSVEKAGFLPGTFDLVALWDVIEHVENPEALLCQARALLRPGGSLVLETPDESCPARHLVRFIHRVTAGRISFLGLMYFTAHRWYFSRRAMKAALDRAGFPHIRFYREQTVKEFGRRKHASYGMRRTLSQRLACTFGDAMGTIPWLRNKMVVIATI